MSSEAQTLTSEQTTAILVELCGGARVVEMLTAHHAADPRDRLSVRDLAQRHRLPKSVVQYQMTQARARLRRCSLLPPAWEAGERRRAGVRAGSEGSGV